MDTPPTSAPANEAELRCVSCGYGLTGVRIGDNCPECGTVINQFASNAGQSSGKAIASMVLGIVSLITCFAYGIIGLPCGIIAVVLAKKATVAVQEGKAPASSLGMVKAGRICGWIGIALNGIAFLIMVVYMILFVGIIAAGAAGGGGGGLGP